MKLKDQTILFFSLPRHDEKYSSTPWQLAIQLAAANDVLFVDHPFTWLEMIRRFWSAPVRKRLLAYFSAKTIWKGDVEIVLPPFVWPSNFLPKGWLYDAIQKRNERAIARRINANLRKKGLSSIIYINSFEFYFPTLQNHLSVPRQLTVYHCIDPMVKGYTIRHGGYLQDRIASHADLIISTAPSLQASFVRPSFPISYLVPNGANFELFNAALSQVGELHTSVRTIQGPVMGYLGNIERRTNFSLLMEALDQLPGWTLVMAGPVEPSFVPEKFRTHPRIVMTGSVPQQEAAQIVKRFDVALIPFLEDEAGKGIYPLKLFEYMACGKPVVSTNFNPEVLETLEPYVRIASTPSDFAAAIALENRIDTTFRMAERISIAAKNSWKQRAELFSLYLLKHLPQ